MIRKFAVFTTLALVYSGAHGKPYSIVANDGEGLALPAVSSLSSIADDFPSITDFPSDPQSTTTSDASTFDSHALRGPGAYHTSTADDNAELLARQAPTPIPVTVTVTSTRTATTTLTLTSTVDRTSTAVRTSTSTVTSTVTGPPLVRTSTTTETNTRTVTSTSYTNVTPDPVTTTVTTTPAPTEPVVA